MAAVAIDLRARAGIARGRVCIRVFKFCQKVIFPPILHGSEMAAI